MLKLHDPKLETRLTLFCDAIGDKPGAVTRQAVREFIERTIADNPDVGARMAALERQHLDRNNAIANRPRPW